MSEKTQLDAGQTEPLKVEFVHIANKEWLFLGEAIEWIMSRGRIVPEERYDKWWRAAERVLFRRLDASGGGGELASAQGYPADNGSRVYESLPPGIWAKMKGISMPGSQFDPSRDPLFSPVDDSEKCDNGGTIWFRNEKEEEEKWVGVRLRTEFVLRHWPSKAAANGSAAGTPLQGGDPRELIERGKTWLEDKYRDWDQGKGRRLKRQEAVEELCRIFPPMKPTWARAAWEDAKLPKWKVKGPHKRE